MIHLLLLSFHDGRATIGPSVWIWTHNKLFLLDFHRFGELFDTSDSTLSGMWRWSPRRLRLRRNVFVELWRGRSIVQDFNISPSTLLNISLIHFIWGLIRNLIVILLFSCRRFESECGLGADFRSPVRNLRTLEFI